VLEAFAAKRGYDAVSAANGQDALAILSAGASPRLAILDWMMPGMEGTEVCRKLRERSSDRPSVYVLLLTARSQRGDLVKGSSPAPTITSLSPSIRPNSTLVCAWACVFWICRTPHRGARGTALPGHS
jgi:CheY-like chemotaxis protein